MHIVDALNQITLQVIERLQVSDVSLDEVYKFFGLERLYDIIINSFGRNDDI